MTKRYCCKYQEVFPATHSPRATRRTILANNYKPYWKPIQVPISCLFIAKYVQHCVSIQVRSIIIYSVCFGRALVHRWKCNIICIRQAVESHSYAGNPKVPLKNSIWVALRKSWKSLLLHNYGSLKLMLLDLRATLNEWVNRNVIIKSMLISVDQIK